MKPGNTDNSLAIMTTQDCFLKPLSSVDGLFLFSCYSRYKSFIPHQHTNKVQYLLDLFTDLKVAKSVEYLMELWFAFGVFIALR